MATKLSGRDVHAMNVLEKYGELLLDESGVYFSAAGARSGIDRRTVEKLEKVQVCRIDCVGQSTFAVFIGRAA